MRLRSPIEEIELAKLTPFAIPDKRIVRNPYRQKRQVTPGATNIVHTLVEAIKAQTRATGIEQIHSSATELLQKLRLLDKNGNFLVSELATISGNILPTELTLKDVDTLIDRMAAALTENEFAADLFEKLSQYDDWSDLKKRFVEFGPEELPQFIAFSIILQNLTEAMFKNIELLSAVLTFWLKIVDEKKLTKHMSIPLRIKYESIMYPAMKYNEYVLNGKCPDDFTRFLLPINIMEAVILDVCRGYFGNACAGYELAKHSTGVHPNPKTGAGATGVKNGAITTGQDLVETWDDLYQVWNAFFVATFGTTFLVKLLIPQVSEYHGDDKPDAYAYNRVIALIVNLFIMTFDHFDVAKDHTGKTQSVFVNKILLKQKDFFRIWGEANNESAARYAEDVKDANGGIN